MKLTTRKKLIMIKILTALTIILIFLLNVSNVFATSGGIGTAEVQTATDNIKRVITAIAMSLRWCFDICKYSNCCD